MAWIGIPEDIQSGAGGRFYNTQTGAYSWDNPDAPPAPPSPTKPQSYTGPTQYSGPHLYGVNPASGQWEKLFGTYDLQQAADSSFAAPSAEMYFASDPWARQQNLAPHTRGWGGSGFTLENLFTPEAFLDPGGAIPMMEGTLKNLAEGNYADPLEVAQSLKPLSGDQGPRPIDYLGMGRLADTGEHPLNVGRLAGQAMAAYGAAAAAGAGGAAGAGAEGAGATGATAGTATSGGLTAAEQAALASGWEGAVAESAAQNAALGAAGTAAGGAAPTFGAPMIEGLTSGGSGALEAGAGAATGITGSHLMQGAGAAGATTAGVDAISSSGGGAPGEASAGSSGGGGGASGGGGSGTAGAGGGGSALSSFFNSTGLSGIFGDDPYWLRLLGQAAPGLLGALAAGSQAEDLEDLSHQYLQMGQPYRSRLEQLYANPNAFLTSPEVMGPIQQGTDALARSLSVKGNPAGSGNALQELQNYASTQLFNRLGEEKNRLANFGGLSRFSEAAPGAATNAVNAQRGVYDALGGMTADVFNPPRRYRLEDLLRGIY